MGVRTSSTDFVCNLTHPQEQYVMISYVVNVALNGVFSITAALENAVMLVALVKTCGLLARSRALFINLAITDLAASITSQPLWSAVLNAALHDTPILCATLKKAADMSASILCGVSIATITLISVDRLLALRSPHHPGTKTSQSKKLQVLLTFVWIASVAVALTKLWNFRIFYGFHSAVIFICVVLSSYCYVKIFCVISRQKASLQRAYSYGLKGLRKRTSSNARLVHYKKSVSSGLCVYIALLVCYMPFVVLHSVWVIFGGNDKLFVPKVYSFTLVFINSSLNPVLYCWKSRTVRRSVKKVLVSLFWLRRSN